MAQQDIGLTLIKHDLNHFKHLPTEVENSLADSGSTGKGDIPHSLFIHLGKFELIFISWIS